MSTRRARIKAVTSLPPRRKNNDAADNNKAKVIENETIVKPIKSPRTPRGSRIQDNFDRPSPKPGSPLKSPRSVNNVFQYQSERVSSPLAQTEVTKEVPHTPKRSEKEVPVTPKRSEKEVPLTPKRSEKEVPVTPNRLEKEVPVTPRTSEKVSVITSISSAKSNNVFVSPRNVGSPARRLMVSPVVHNSRVEVNVQRLTPVTPEVSEKLKQKSVERRPSNDDKFKEARKDVPCTIVSSDIPDDYSVPSVPESITEDTVMDGIVPLQAARSVPKPLALLKNEIISENAEVLFDPIVPLPSPSKVRPKLRPIPRLAPLRRNSVQGSASESEDESRRALLSSGGASTPAPPRQRHDSHTSHSTMHSVPNREANRFRNDSVCSSVSQATALLPTVASPVKDKHVSKTRRLDTARRSAAMRRRRETVKKDTLTMYDLIFYNPSSNPIIPDKDEIKVQEANKEAQEEAARKAAKEAEDKGEDQSETETDAAPVPQIKLGPNGEIMLDETSLVIKQSEKRKVSSGVVHEGAWASNNLSARYRRTPRTADWSDAETVRFYRALAALGTDFMLMENLFPGRTRRDLKLKFKKEERQNMAQVDKALRMTCKWDAARLVDEFQAEREEADRAARAEAAELQRRAREHKQRVKEAKELRVRMSRSSKTLEESILPSSTSSLTVDEVIQRHLEAKANAKKPTPPKSKPRGRPRTNPSPQFPTITRVTPKSKPSNDMATIRKIDTSKSQSQNTLPPSTAGLPANIENGSLVVLKVNDPNAPSKKMLQTYIASGDGRLTPVALPTSFLNSVVTYMSGTGVSTAGSSPHLTSPSSVASQDSRSSSTPGVIQMNSSPNKRQRHSSYKLTPL